MTPEDITIAMEWARIEGWEPGNHDGPCFFSADPEGFLIGLLDDEPVATLSAVRYGDGFGYG